MEMTTTTPTGESAGVKEVKELTLATSTLEQLGTGEGQWKGAGHLVQLGGRERRKLPAACVAKKEAVSKDIDQILATVLDASSCAICLDVVAHPFSIACGHSYCAPCLREYIAVELRVKKLPAIQEDRIVGHKHHPSACSTVPSTLAQLLSLEEAIEDHGFNAAETLAYPCPECKQAFHTAPHRNEALGRLLSGVFKLHKDRIAATGRSIASNLLPANVFSDEPFLGLFHSSTRTVN
ncbi:hypothetical protein BKA70DRAFT_1435376 [Coprinopsis sp. MPI-PUGE-AT-0042]|nr:hypothetical protein BKA70DRAFT_1435376 [Coprinopsis sp. MPI-PUGE-AT-0042]